VLSGLIDVIKLVVLAPYEIDPADAQQAANRIMVDAAERSGCANPIAKVSPATELAE
jgi:hypothetical protein